MRDIVSKCAGTYKTAMQKNLLAVRDELDDKSSLYQSAARSAECWKLDPADFTVSRLTKAEMEAAYAQRLVAQDGPGRPYYDAQLALAQLGRCPYCDQGIVKTLDHYLPKSRFPALALDPWNLVPSCRDCNSVLRDLVSSSSDDEQIHPYYWEDDDCWLRADLVPGVEPVVGFSVACPPGWELSTCRRVVFHFNRLRLGALYSTLAATALLEEASKIRPLVHLGDGAAIVGYLEECVEDMAKRIGPNYWRVALLRAIAAEPWFWQTYARCDNPVSGG